MEPQYPPTLSQNQQSCDDLYEEEGHIYGARQDTSVPLSDQYHLQVSTESSPQDRGNNDEGAILPQSLSLPLLEDTAVSRQLLSAQNEAFPDATVQHGQLHPHFLSGLTDEYYTLLPLQQQPVFQPTMGYQFQGKTHGLFGLGNEEMRSMNRLTTFVCACSRLPSHAESSSNAAAKF